MPLLLPFLLAAAPVQPRACPWVAAWGSSQMSPGADNALPQDRMTGAALRQTVRVSTNGWAARVRFSNAFGRTPLRIGAASLARPVRNDGAALMPGSARALLFDGASGVVVPPGADWWSDPVPTAVAAFADLSITVVLEAEADGRTSHPGSRATSYFLKGARADAADLPGAERTDHWFFLSGVEVRRCGGPAGVVAFGDSITDGFGVKPNSNARWTDFLAHRLGGRAAVVNQGIGGNRVLLDGLGPNALARFERDVLSQPGVGHVIVLEGINDLGVLQREKPAGRAEQDALVAQLTGAYAQMIARGHARGIRVYGATVMPFATNAYYHPDAGSERMRAAVNAWIRAPGHFDAVIDFDRALRDPARPDRLNPAYDGGDGLHPSEAGYRAMADAVPLALFR